MTLADQPDRIGAHDAPSGVHLAASVARFLRDDLSTKLAGRDRYLARVAANMLDIAAREFDANEQDQLLHRRVLEQFGATSNETLGAAIRRGDLDDRTSELVASLWEVAISKLSVSNPSYRDRALEP